MKFLKILILIFFTLNPNYLFAVEENKVNKITKNLRCLICQGQSVYDSDSEFANSLKILVKKKLKEGIQEEEIYNYMKDKYGEWILYDPKFNKNTYFLWILPILLFLVGGLVVFRLFIINKN